MANAPSANFFISKVELEDFAEDSLSTNILSQLTHHNQINFVYHILPQTKFYFTSISCIRAKLLIPLTPGMEKLTEQAPPERSPPG